MKERNKDMYISLTLMDCLCQKPTHIYVDVMLVSLILLPMHRIAVHNNCVQCSFMREFFVGVFSKHARTILNIVRMLSQHEFQEARHA